MAQPNPRAWIAASRKDLWLLYFCVFLVMAGYGITLPVFPFYTERIASLRGISDRGLALQVGLLTSVYVLMQFLFAPLWGTRSDRLGRKPLIVVGVAGYGIGQLLYGSSTSLFMLYGSRIVGGVLSAALLPAASSFVADVTGEKERATGMAWLGAMTSLGVVIGPSLGGLLTRTGLRFKAQYGPLLFDHSSIPFLAAGGLALASLPIVITGFHESYHLPRARASKAPSSHRWRVVAKAIQPLLVLTLISQFGLTTYAATFALYAHQELGYGPPRVGAVFTMCGLVMAVAQVGVVKLFAKRRGERDLIAAGFGLMGAGLFFLLFATELKWVLSAVAIMALGQALIAPNLLALTSKVGQPHTGAALGLQDAAASLGQTAGPLLGTILFSWKAGAPFLLTGALLMIVGLGSLRLSWQSSE